MYICIRLIINAADNSLVVVVIVFVVSVFILPSESLLVSSSFSCVIVVATAFFVGRFFLKHTLSLACTRCCDLGISVVMEHSPAVVGSDADSDAAAPADRSG